MRARAAVIGAVVAAGALGVVAPPAAGVADAARSERAPVELKVPGQVSRLGPDGPSVRVRIRCEPGLQPFELHVDIRQAAAVAAGSLVAPPLVVACDGSWNRVAVPLAPVTGELEAGAATVSAALFAYVPPPVDADVEATATGSIRLRPPKGG